jgi:hypothetical protein
VDIPARTPLPVADNRDRGLPGPEERVIVQITPDAGVVLS